MAAVDGAREEGAPPLGRRPSFSVAQGAEEGGAQEEQRQGAENGDSPGAGTSADVNGSAVRSGGEGAGSASPEVQRAAEAAARARRRRRARAREQQRLAARRQQLGSTPYTYTYGFRDASELRAEYCLFGEGRHGAKVLDGVLHHMPAAIGGAAASPSSASPPARSPDEEALLKAEADAEARRWGDRGDGAFSTVLLPWPRAWHAIPRLPPSSRRFPARRSIYCARDDHSC